MYNQQELVQYINNSRKEAYQDPEIIQQLLNQGWKQGQIETAITHIADEYERKRKKMFYLKRLFYGRLNQIDFLIGIGFMYTVIELIRQFISLDFSVFTIPLYALLLFFYFSLVTRRLSDTGIKRSPQFATIALLGSVFLAPLMVVFFIVYPGQIEINEDGYPTNSFLHSHKRILGLE